MRVADLPPLGSALSGRVILVAGAHGGLGEATAMQAAAAGATVVLLGRKVPKLTRLYDAIERAGGPTPAIYPLDLEGASPADYEQLATSIERELGRLDGIVHAAAAFGGLAGLETLPAEDWLRALQVNLTAPFLLTRACLPLLRKAADGAAVFVLDAPERIARAYWGGYAVSKAGLQGLIAVLADELEPSTVRVLGLQPGPMRTALRARAYYSEPNGAPPEAAEYAPACLWALSPAAVQHRGQTVVLSE